MKLERAIPTVSLFTLAAACGGAQQVPSDTTPDAGAPDAPTPDAGTDPGTDPAPDPIETTPAVPSDAVGTPIEALVPMFSDICEAYAQCYPDAFGDAFESTEGCVETYVAEYVTMFRDGSLPLDVPSCAAAFEGYLGCVAEMRCSGYLDYACLDHFMEIEYGCYGYDGGYPGAFDYYDGIGEE